MSLIWILMIILAALVGVLLYEESPQRFADPEPFFPLREPRHWRTSMAGGRPKGDHHGYSRK